MRSVYHLGVVVKSFACGEGTGFQRGIWSIGHMESGLWDNLNNSEGDSLLQS